MADARAMSQSDFLRRIDAKLRDAGIPCMLTGSLASGAYGRARATEDIDILIDPTAQQLEQLLQSLSSNDYYVSAEAARDALRARTMFNVIDMSSGWKVDLIILKSQSDRQYHDAARVAVGQRASLDVDYLRHWAAELGLAAELEQLLNDAAEMQSE
jgi:hypothetical protein